MEREKNNKHVEIQRYTMRKGAGTTQKKRQMRNQGCAKGEEEQNGGEDREAHSELWSEY